MGQTNLTASAQLNNGKCEVYGITVNSHSSGTIRFYDDVNTDTFNPIGGAYTYASGSSVVLFPKPIICNNGCYAVLTNTQDILVHWQKLN